MYVTEINFKNDCNYLKFIKLSKSSSVCSILHNVFRTL